MQFGIKSLLGAMVLLAAFVMGVFQFSDAVCVWTLIITHALSPAIWVAGFSANQTRGLKTFFLSGLISGIAPWIATLYWCIAMGMQNGLDSSTGSELEKRLIMLVVWSSSGVIAIVGGLLGVWVQACCRPANCSDNLPSPVLPAAVDPLAPEVKLDR